MIPLHLSYSQVSTLSECGFKYKLERVDEVQPAPAWWNVGGRAVHETLDWVVTEPNRDPDQASEYFTFAFTRAVDEALLVEPRTELWRVAGRSSKANPDKENGAWWLQTAPRWIAAFCAAYDTFLLPDKVAAGPDDTPLTEVEFDINLGGVPVKGVIDAVMERQTEDGGTVWYARDYKAGSRAVTDATQLAVYDLAIAAVFDRGRAGFGQYYDVRHADAAELPTTQFTGERMGELFRTADIIRTEHLFLPHPSSFCKSCSVRSACPWSASPDN